MSLKISKMGAKFLTDLLTQMSWTRSVDDLSHAGSALELMDDKYAKIPPTVLKSDEDFKAWASEEVTLDLNPKQTATAKYCVEYHAAKGKVPVNRYTRGLVLALGHEGPVAGEVTHEITLGALSSKYLFDLITKNTWTKTFDDLVLGAEVLDILGDDAAKVPAEITDFSADNPTFKAWAEKPRPKFTLTERQREVVKNVLDHYSKAGDIPPNKHSRGLLKAFGY